MAQGDPVPAGVTLQDLAALNSSAAAPMVAQLQASLDEFSTALQQLGSSAGLQNLTDALAMLANATESLGPALASNISQALLGSYGFSGLPSGVTVANRTLEKGQMRIRSGRSVASVIEVDIPTCQVRSPPPSLAGCTSFPLFPPCLFGGRMLRLLRWMLEVRGVG